MSSSLVSFQLYNIWKNEPKIKRDNNQGGNFYPSAIKKSSCTFLSHVNNALNRNMLLHMDAYRLTGLKGDTFHKILNSPFFIQDYEIYNRFKQLYNSSPYLLSNRCRDKLLEFNPKNNIYIQIFMNNQSNLPKSMQSILSSVLDNMKHLKRLFKI